MSPLPDPPPADPTQPPEGAASCSFCLKVALKAHNLLFSHPPYTYSRHILLSVPPTGNPGSFLGVWLEHCGTERTKIITNVWLTVLFAALMTHTCTCSLMCVYAHTNAQCSCTHMHAQCMDTYIITCTDVYTHMCTQRASEAIPSVDTREPPGQQETNITPHNTFCSLLPPLTTSHSGEPHFLL